MSEGGGTSAGGDTDTVASKLTFEELSELNERKVRCVASGS